MCQGWSLPLSYYYTAYYAFTILAWLSDHLLAVYVHHSWFFCLGVIVQVPLLQYSHVVRNISTPSHHLCHALLILHDYTASYPLSLCTTSISYCNSTVGSCTFSTQGLFKNPWKICKACRFHNSQTKHKFLQPFKSLGCPACVSQSLWKWYEGLKRPEELS